MAGTENNQRGQGECVAQAVENHLKLWNKEGEVENQNGQCEEEQHARIKHGGCDLGFEIFLASLEISDLSQNQIEESARFAGLDHCGIDAGKSIGRARHSVGEGHAVDDEVVDFLPFSLSGGVRGLFMENSEGA